MNSWGWLMLKAVGVFAGMRAILWVYNHGFDAAKQKVKLENQQPLAGLRNFGLAADSSVHPAWEQASELAKYLGHIDGYPVEIFIKCQPAGYWGEYHFIVRVSFTPDRMSASDSVGQVLKNKAGSNFFKYQDGVTLSANCGERRMAIGRFSKPDSRQLFAAAQELASELKKLGLNPAAGMDN